MDALQRAQSELGHAIFRLREHEFALASQAAMSGRDLFATAGAPAGEGLCFAIAAVAMSQQGGIEQAGKALEAASTLARQVGDNGLLATCLEIDADRVSFAGDGDSARTAIQRAHEMHQKAEDMAGVIRTRATLAELTFMIGKPDTGARLLSGLEAALEELPDTPEDELLGRLAGARACDHAAQRDPSAARHHFRIAVAKLENSTVPCVIGRIAANVAHYLARIDHLDDAVEALDVGIQYLQMHGNAALEYKLAAARAVFSMRSNRPADANASLARALALCEGQRDDPRRLAILELGIEIAEALEHHELISERRLALARTHHEAGRFHEAIAALLKAMSVLGESERGGAEALLRDLLYATPLNSTPVHWFVQLMQDLVDVGDLDLPSEFLQARASMERGADLAYVLAALGELAILRDDPSEADRLYFDAIHQARLYGLPERDQWIARHEAILGQA